MFLFNKNLILILLLSIVLSFSFGMATMNMDKNGNMTDCPFSDSDVFCPMSFAEHVAIFQSTFTAIPYKTISLLALTTVGLLTLFFRLDPRIYSPPASSGRFVKNNFTPLFFNNLLLAISDGRLQPKLYA